MAASEPAPMSCDVVVVGAGLAGLCAAWKVLEAGHSAAVVEADGRVGGRNLTTAIRGVNFDLGGQWVGPTHNELLALAKSLGVETHKQYCKGKRVMDVRNRVSTYSTDIPTPAGVLALLDVQQLITRAESCMKTVPAGRPWDCPDAEKWDSLSVAAVVKDWAYTSAGGELFAAAVRGVFGVEPADLSFLHFLNYAAAAGSIESLVTIDGGFQDSTFKYGAQQLSEKLAERIKLNGGHVHLSHAVQTVEQTDDGGVTVRCAGDLTLRCRRVIVAMPPASAAHINYVPMLPHNRRQLMSRAFMGCIIKTLVLYEHAFWREEGYSGEVVCDNVSGPGFNAYDDSLEGPDGTVQPALVVFTNAKAASYWTNIPAKERHQAIVAQLVRWFGIAAASPLEIVEKNWMNDPYTQGCPIAVWGPGELTAGGSCLREPVGRIHWAGTETSDVCMGFMEGAVRSGYRVAEEVDLGLRQPAPAPLPTDDMLKGQAGADPFARSFVAQQRWRCSVLGTARLCLIVIAVILALVGATTIAIATLTSTGRQAVDWVVITSTTSMFDETGT